MKTVQSSRLTHKARLLAGAIVLSLCNGWIYSPAYAEIVVIPEDWHTQGGTINNSDVVILQGISENFTFNNSSCQSITYTGFASGTRLNDRSSQGVEGVANNTVLNDFSLQHIREDGTTNDTTLNHNSSQAVIGTANDTTLNHNSSQVVTGTANDTTLNHKSSQSIEYGTANRTTLWDLSSQTVIGTANDTTLHDYAWQVVKASGVANGSVLNNDSWQGIFFGGVANDTTLNHNSSQSIEYGTANRTTLWDLSSQVVTGTANDTTLHDHAWQFVEAGGSSYRSQVNNQAAMVVTGGAAAYDTTVNSGMVYLYKDAVLANSTATDAIKINSGGTLAVVEDGAAVAGNVAMQDGAIAFLRQGASYSHASGMTVNAGNNYKTLTIEGDLSGGGQLAMSTNVTNGSGDRLIVNGAVTGSYQVGFTNDATAAANGKESVLGVIQPGGGTGVFSGEVEYGGYVYELEQNLLGHWDLIGTGRASSSSSASYSTFSASYLLNYAETTTLYQRLGDLRRGEVSASPWIRVYGGRYSVDPGQMVSGYGMSYRGIQIGGDCKKELSNDRGTIYTGGMLGYTTSGQSYQSGDGSASSTTLGLYRTHVDPQGRYASVVAKYGWMNNDYKVLDTASTWVEGSLSTQGPSLSLEAGQRLYADKVNKQGWYMEPQAQLSFGRQSGGRFTASNGLSVNVNDYSSVLGRLGMVIGRETLQASRPVNTYAKLSYVKEFSGDIGFSLNGSPAKEKLGSTWWSYGAGIATQLDNDNNLYLDITRATGGNFTQCWQLNFGIRGQFN